MKTPLPKSHFRIQPKLIVTLHLFAPFWVASCVLRDDNNGPRNYYLLLHISQEWNVFLAAKINVNVCSFKFGFRAGRWNVKVNLESEPPSCWFLPFSLLCWIKLRRKKLVNKTSSKAAKYEQVVWLAARRNRIMKRLGLIVECFLQCCWCVLCRKEMRERAA